MNKTEVGIIKKFELGPSGVNKKGEKWQMYNYTIANHPQANGFRYSSFDKYPFTVGDTVKIYYTEKPNPRNPQYSYKTISAMEQGELSQQHTPQPTYNQPVQQVPSQPVPQNYVQALKDEFRAKMNEMLSPDYIEHPDIARVHNDKHAFYYLLLKQIIDEQHLTNMYVEFVESREDRLYGN